MIKTEIIKTEKGHQVGFTIGVQTFYLKEREIFDSDKMTSLEYAQWYEKQLEVAFWNLIIPVVSVALPRLKVGDNIKLYGKETTVTGFELSYNDALTPPKYEIILLTTGRGDPFYRSLEQIEVIGN